MKSASAILSLLPILASAPAATGNGLPPIVTIPTTIVKAAPLSANMENVNGITVSEKPCYNPIPQPHRPAAPRRPPTSTLARRHLSPDAIAALLDDGQRRAFDALRQLSAQTATPTYLVGGPVRDALLGAPLLDLDFAIEGNAPALAQQLAEHLGPDTRLTVHPRFGTATITLPPSTDHPAANIDFHIDLVTARSESYLQPGQLPIITPGDIADDLARRDFTINALALPLTPQPTPLLDPHGGLDDLDAGIIRHLHPRSFIDDPTRMLRAVRYEQRFRFRIHPATQAAISDALAQGYMNAVSGDRWRRELERILDEPNPLLPLQRAAELGLLTGLHPALTHAPALRQLPTASDRPPTPDNCLAALFAPLSPHNAEQVIRRLRLSGRRAALSRDTIALRESEPQIRAGAAQPSNLARLLAGRQPAAVAAWAALTQDPEVATALRRYANELQFIKPQLNGAALLAIGIPQGPTIGEILSRLQDARLDGAVQTANDELALAQRIARSRDDDPTTS